MAWRLLQFRYFWLILMIKFTFHFIYIHIWQTKIDLWCVFWICLVAYLFAFLFRVVMSHLDHRREHGLLHAANLSIFCFKFPFVIRICLKKSTHQILLRSGKVRVGWARGNNTEHKSLICCGEKGALSTQQHIWWQCFIKSAVSGGFLPLLHSAGWSSPGRTAQHSSCKVAAWVDCDNHCSLITNRPNQKLAFTLDGYTFSCNYTALEQRCKYHNVAFCRVFFGHVATHACLET